MTAPTPQMIISGVPYRVVDVDAHLPVVPSDVLGATGFVVEGSTGRHRVVGEGAVVGDVVRFHEKAEAGGKDVRVWHVHEAPDGGLVAEVT